MMEYTIKAHPTTYNGVEFRSRLEATWAAFFDLAGLKWEYEPIDLEGWVPDFYIEWPRSECRSWIEKHGLDYKHRLYVEVKPYSSFDDFNKHEVSRIDPKLSPHPAMFGLNPNITRFSLGGTNHSHQIEPFIDTDKIDPIYVIKMRMPYGNDDYVEIHSANVDLMWKHAQNITRWKPSA